MDSKSVLLIRRWFLLFGVISSLVFELHAQSGRYTIYQEVSGTLTICNNLVVNNVDASATNVSTALENNILGENTTVLMDNQQDFTIKPGSVAVNAGDNTCVTWLNGMSREKRRQQNVVDIGAFEVYYKYEDTLFTIFQEMAGALTLCNNIIINNVADSLTNVVSIPINNITGENTQVFTDNYLDFSIKPGSSAVNAGERLYVNWSYDMCREKRTQQDRVDIGAFETYYRHEDTLYLIYHEGVNTLSFCNNLIIINVADSLTNVTTMPANNITGEEISVFTDNYLDFGLKPGSIAVNSGEDECPIWGRDLRGLYRKWGVVDVGAYEAKSLIGAGYTVEQEDLGTLLLYNNIVIQNPGSIGACNINAVDSSINLLNDVGNVFVGNDDYSLGETSPAVNMGDNQYVVFLNDMKGESRIACEEPVDLGAYEVQALHNIYLTDVVCGVGQPYHRYGFDIDSVPAGETTFTRSVMSGLVCDSAYQLTITGNHSYLYQDYATICDNEVYVWQGHEHVTIGQLAAGIYTVWDSLTTQEGCDSVYQLKLTVNPSYLYQVYDAICENEVYVWQEREHVTIGQLTAGAYTFYDSLTTVNGCDSVVTLHLTLTGPPQVIVTATDTTICAGDEVTLAAVVQNASAVVIPPPPPAVAIGDILCTDGTTEKPSAYASSGKTAMGVVFYVDNTGEHGWAVHLQDQGANIVWGNNGVDIPYLNNFPEARDAIADMDGYNNTFSIRYYNNSYAYPAAWLVDFDNGWYLPACGQLKMLHAERAIVNNSLQIVNGTPMPVGSSGWTYWSSTEKSATSAGTVDSFGHVNSLSKSANLANVRSVRSF